MSQELTDRELVAAFLQQVGGYSGKEVEREVPGVSQSDVSRWRRGKFSTLTAAKRRAVARFLQRPGRLERLRSHAEPTAMPRIATNDEAEGAAPNYEGLGIDLPGYERLQERPRRKFDRFMLELIGMGLAREDLEVLGRGAIAPIVELNTLHKGKHEADTRIEENQMLILDHTIPAMLEMARERRR